MTASIHRRRLLIAAATWLPLSQLQAASNIMKPPRHVSANAQFTQIEAMSGGRLGVAVLDTGSGKSWGYREAERFPFCSTFKLLLAAAVLARVDAGVEKLMRPLPYSEVDLLEYAPITRAHVADGSMMVGELCAAAIQYSDNTAANLLLTSIGGPGALTAWLRAQGDNVTRLDRTGPTLNTAIKGDERDTTTPEAMLASTQKLVLGNVLSNPSRQQLQDWLMGNTTGDARLRAGLPKDWRVGDKTGTGENGASNDVAVIWPKGRAPLVVVSFLSETSAKTEVRNATHVEVARAIVAAVG